MAEHERINSRDGEIEIGNLSWLFIVISAFNHKLIIWLRQLLKYIVKTINYIAYIFYIEGAMSLISHPIILNS